MSGANTFNFKRFAVDQNGCAMKIGTDGVLLGAWCRVNPDLGLEPDRTAPAPELESDRVDHPDRDKAILDIGTGTGVIALQLAQRTEGAKTRIEAVEIDSGACVAARRNFEASDWADRLTLHCTSAQEFTLAPPISATPSITVAPLPQLFDHIVSNPPYFVDSLTSPNKSRNLARHTQTLSYDDLMKCCFILLKPDGRVSLILPTGAETEKMIAAADAHDFCPTRRTEVHSTARSGPRRTLLEFMRKGRLPETPSTPESDTLTIEGDGPGTFSTEYRALTRDFYLYF